MEAGEGASRGRVPIAIGTAVLLVALVAIVALAGGGDGAEAQAAPAECLKEWNSDPSATGYGQHNYASHDYRLALVLHLTREGEEDDAGLCAVAFPSRFLDPEKAAAGAILTGNWAPLSALPAIPITRIAELQARAAAEANAELESDGTLSAL